MFISVNCEWGEWVQGDCSATCGGGTHTKTRTKAIKEQYGGSCVGVSSMQEDCNTLDCPCKPEGLINLKTAKRGFFPRSTYASICAQFSFCFAYI